MAGIEPSKAESTEDDTEEKVLYREESEYPMPEIPVEVDCVLSSSAFGSLAHGECCCGGEFDADEWPLSS